ncbi:hypothetical protein [Alienimonas chondri]|uniref:hypothetical protein n=1 Tax=Alienimonas chondri TaxID=2681879 RepID=UPI001487ADC0|nr:hypothetical protein [Alienimonas chondri]
MTDDPFHDPLIPEPAGWRPWVWLGAVPLAATVANFGLLLACDAFRIDPIWMTVNDLYNACGRGVWADMVIMSFCSVPATGIGCVWLLRRGGPRAWRNVGLYALLGGAWLLGCAVATVTTFRAAL